MDFDSGYDNTQTYSQIAVEQYQAVVEDIVQQVPDCDANIIEIGCGRGELLELLRVIGYRNIHGYDPAAPSSSDLIENVYWNGGLDSSGEQSSGVDLIILRHTIEEVKDPGAFLRLLSGSLKDNGLIYCEITNAAHLLELERVFSLYPECANIFSALSLSTIYGRCGLSVEKITNIHHGEWLGVWAKKSRVVGSDHIVDGLAAIRASLCSLPRPLVLWGCGGMGMNILAFLHLDLETIQFVVDLNPAKRGKFIPPFGQEVISPSDLSHLEPKAILVANKRYKDEVLGMSVAGCQVFDISDLISCLYC